MPVLRSIRLRLTLWYLVLLALILAGFSAGVYLTLRQDLYENLDDSLETRAEGLLSSVRFEESGPTLEGFVPPAGDSEIEQFVRVFDASGVLAFEAAPLDAPGDAQAVGDALAGREATRTLHVRGQAFRAHVRPIRSGDEIRGVLEVGQTEADIHETLRTLLIILGLSYPATLAVASLGGVFLAGRALSPIDRLTQVARRLSAEDLSRRLDLDLPDDEVGRLARTFDEMIARLDAAFRRQRQFTADASHELRTPLTTIKGQVEVALGRERSPAAYQEVLRSVNDEVDRMVRLVSSLLTLARADAGQIGLDIELVAVGELVADAVEQVGALARERGIELQVEAGPETTVRADQDLLLQLLLNLLDNAVKYTPAGGRVTVGWDGTGRGVELRVSDTGPGIAGEHLPHLFERFYRVDKARSRADGGVGLGLSIGRWIAEAHGGSLSVASAAGQGATFTLTLPGAAR